MTNFKGCAKILLIIKRIKNLTSMSFLAHQFDHLVMLIVTKFPYNTPMYMYYVYFCVTFSTSGQKACDGQFYINEVWIGCATVRY